MRHRGFSLVEMMVTLAIFALVLLTALPGINDWIDNTRIRNVTDSVQTGVQLARGEAVKQNRNITFWLVNLSNPSTMDNACTLSSTSGSWVVSVSDPTNPGHCADSPSTTTSPMIVSARAVGENGGRGITVSAIQTGTTGATSVTFNGFGRVVNSNAITKIDVSGPRSTDRILRLVISPVGQVRMCDPNVSSSTDPRVCP